MGYPAPLPEAVRTGSAAVKVVYLYLLPLGWVDLTRRALAERLGVTPLTLNRALKQLEREGLLEYQGERTPRQTAPYRIAK